MLGGRDHAGVGQPAANAAACVATVAGSLPYWRPKAPIGGFAAPAGTVSATGARSTRTPAARSWPPQVRPAPAARPGSAGPGCSALGIGEKPGPLSTWTAPPSWSVATSTARAAVTAACTRAVSAAVAAVPAWLRPVRMTPPTW